MKPFRHSMMILIACGLLSGLGGCDALPNDLTVEEIEVPELIPGPTATPVRPVRRGLKLGLCDQAQPSLLNSHGLFIAQHFDTVVTSEAADLAPLKEINPDLQVYLNWNAQFLSIRQQEADLPVTEEMYLYDTYSNLRLARLREGQQEFMMDPGSQAWREFSLSQIRALLEGSGFDGVVLQDVWGDLHPRRLQDENGVSLETTYGIEPSWYDVNEYRQNMAGYIQFIKEGLAGKTVLFNGISRSGIELEYLPRADGSQTGEFVYGGDDYGYTFGDSWREVMQNMLDASGEKGFMPITYGGLEDHQARLYALASYYIGVGENTVYAYSPDCSTLTYLPEYGINLGAPLETYADIRDYYDDGSYMYSREFEKGIVYVNHGGATRPLTFEQPMYLLVLERGLISELGGGGDLYFEVVQSLEIPSQNGVILLYRHP